MQASDLFLWGAVGLTVAIITLALVHPGLRQWIVDHPWLTRGIGMAVGLAGLALVFIDSPRSDEAGAMVINAAVLLLLVSAVLVILPTSITRYVRQLEANRENAPALKAVLAAPPGDTAIGWRDGVAALRQPLVSGQAGLRILAPWIALASAVLLAFGALPDNFAKTEPVGVSVAILVVSFLVVVLSIPTVAVAWHRFVGAGFLPATGVALPDRAVLGYMRRLWFTLIILGFMIGVVDRGAPAIAAFLHIGQVAAVTAGLEWLVRLAGLAAVSLYSLVLPAVAMGNLRVTITQSNLTLRRIYPAFLAGLATAALPYPILLWLLGKTLGDVAEGDLSLAQGVLSVIAVSLVLLTVASVAGYLSRVYAKTLGALA